MDISTILGFLFLAALLIIPIILAIAAFLGLGRVFYKVPGPDEALVITGRGAKPTREFQAQLAAEKAAAAKKRDGEGPTLTKDLLAADPVEPDPEFKIVVGVGSWLKPGQRMERLSLRAQQAPVELKDVPTVQGITLHTSATVLYKVGDTYSAIARAARRFAGNNNWTDMVKDVLEGKLREVVGTMTVEEVWRDRKTLAAKVAETSSEELARLGLQIESFQLKPIGDPSGYIENIAAGPKAEKERDAKIIRAEMEQQSAQREAETQTQTQQAAQAARIAQAQARQEADRIEAEANQAKPLAEAKARQAVIEEETRNTELEKELNLQRLQATTYQEADAQKYAQVVNAQAQSETAIIQAEAQAKATQVQADARKDAAASNAEADAVVMERAAQAQAAATEAAAQADARAVTLRAEAAEAEGKARAAAAEAEGLAHAKVTLEQGKAVGESERLKAEAMSANKDAVVELELVRQLPAALAANAQAFARVNNITVTDGVDGFQDGVTGVLQQGIASLPAILHGLKGAGLGAVQSSFDTFTAEQVSGDEKQADRELGGDALAAAAKALASGTVAKDAAQAKDGLADVSSAFAKSAVDVDLSSAGAVAFSAEGVSGALGKAGDFVEQASSAVEQAQEFQEQHGDQLQALAATAAKVKRRTR